MAYTVTTDWDSIQERNIDFSSPITSENHNKLLKAFGTDRMWCSGLDLTLKADTSSHTIYGILDPGIVFLDYMVIEFTEESTIEICGYTAAKEVYIVVEYEYKAYYPVSIASIKCIDVADFDPNIQLKLYQLNLGDWLTASTFPTQVTLDECTEDSRVDSDNIPGWASFVRIDKDSGNVVDYMNEYLENPYLQLTDTTDDKYIKIQATGDSVTIDNTKGTYLVQVNGTTVSQIDSTGVTGAIWNADIAEFFTFDPTDPNLQVMPEQGSCICVENGIAHLSDTEYDPSCVGVVSYAPAYVLGGTTDFEKEFKENHKIPVAVMGQIKDVCAYTIGSEMIPKGAVIVSGLDGKLLAVSPTATDIPIGCVIGKSLTPVYPGDNYIHILLK